MRVNGLTITYKDGVNAVVGSHVGSYPVGDLLCRIFQGEKLYNISRIVRNCVAWYPMQDNAMTPDEVEEAERYILETMLYDDFYPAYRLAQGSFIRLMEEYRALDRVTTARVCEQMSQLNTSDVWYFDNVGFETVGEFLRFCFNCYYVDLLNGISLFKATSAVWSGTADEREQKLYDELCEVLHNDENVPGTEMRTSYNKEDGSFQYSFVINSFLAMAVFEFSHLAESGTKIMRCQNPACGKFFTAKRATAKYCSFEAPQCPGRACSDYYPQIVYREKVRLDEVERLIRNTKGRLYNAKRRHPDQAGDIEVQLSDLVLSTREKKRAVLEGTMTMKEFREWLNSH